MTQHRASTGVAGLDQLLHGGLPSGHFFLVSGAPGSGKTTLGLQFLLAGAAAGERVMYVTLSESERELRDVAHSHGWNIDGISLFEFTPREDVLQAGDTYSAFHPSELEFQDTTQQVLSQVETVRPTRFVLDSLSELRLLARDALRYRRQILALKHYFTNRNCTVILLDDGAGPARDGQHEHSIAHGVILMERMSREYGATRRRIQVLKLRASEFSEGFHDYKIERGGLKVFPRVNTKEPLHAAPAGEVSSGNAALDQLWGGALPWGTSTLISGPAGTGKSTVAFSYAVAAAREGHFAAVFAFDEPRHIMLSRCQGMNLDPRPLLDSGRMHLEQVDPVEMSPGEFMHKIRRCVEERNARVIVIDSIFGLLNALPAEQYLSIQMHELLSYLSQAGVSTFMTLPQNAGAGSQRPVDLSYLADNVLLLRYFEEGGRVRKAVSVMKRRNGRHEDTIRELLTDSRGITLGDPITDFSGVMSGVPEYFNSGKTTG